MAENKPSVSEININPERLRQLQPEKYSADLLRKPFELEKGDELADKVFVMAKIEQQNKIWMLHVENDYPTVALNDKVKEKFKLDESPTINELRKGWQKDTSLISGGSWTWIKSGDQRVLALLRRDKDAPVDAGCLTGPAGRCGELLSKTNIDETNQEMIFVADQEGNIKSLGFYEDTIDKDHVIKYKLNQVKTIRESLEKNGKLDEKNAMLLDLIQSEENIDLIHVDEVRKTDGDLDTVVTMINGEEIDRVENVDVYFDSANNTLEVREELEIDYERIRPGCKIVGWIDGEVFGREAAGVVDLSTLNDEELVPALRNYKKRF